MFKIALDISRALITQTRTSWNFESKNNIFNKSFHTLRPLYEYQWNLNQNSSALLIPKKDVQNTQVCGLKYVGKVHRRCKDCNMMLIAGVMHNHCKTHPRHNQKAKTKRPKSTWIVTAAIQTKIRPW